MQLDNLNECKIPDSILIDVKFQQPAECRSFRKYPAPPDCKMKFLKAGRCVLEDFPARFHDFECEEERLNAVPRSTKFSILELTVFVLTGSALSPRVDMPARRYD